MGGSHTTEGDFNILKHEKSITRVTLANFALEGQMHSKQQPYLKTSQRQIAEVIDTLCQVAEREIAEEN